MITVESLFKFEGLTRAIAKNKENFFVTIGCANYEERSISCIKQINDYAIEQKIDSGMKYDILFLKNKKNNNLVLEGLKSQYSDELNQIFNRSKNSSYTWHKIDFPNNFNSRGLITTLSRKLKKYSLDRGVSLHLDITAMPRVIIFGLCEAISQWLKDETINIKSVHFSCVSPQTFSHLPYAQEVGLMRGLFTGEPITIEEQQDVRTVIFPSMTGHESKLLLDDLNQTAREHKNAIFLQIDADDFLTSMEIMRANQILMEHGDNTQYYYCSLYDATKELMGYIYKEENERKKNSEDCKRLYLIAPFGSKIILPISYFILTKLQGDEKPDLLDIEICHAQGFQYTSVYSIGVGETSTFSLKIDKWK